jgi:cullin 1
LKHSDTIQNELLLKYYAGEWDRYKRATSSIDRIFTFLNQRWVKQHRDRGRKNVFPVYLVRSSAGFSVLTYVRILQLAFVQWHKCFFLPIKEKLVGAILHLIEQQRNGETIDQSLVKKVVESIVSLGIDETDLNIVLLDNYNEHFGIPFLVATEAYYKLESESFLAKNTMSDYLKKAEVRLKEEEDRVQRYLHTTTRKLLIRKCEHVLVRAHADFMCESSQSLLDHDKDEDLYRMYSLLSRIPEGLELLRKKFEEHVERTGLAAVAALVRTDAASLEELDPTAYVDALLEVHTRYSDTVNRSFRGEAGFAASVNRACREFVNRNAATGASLTRSPELLAKHVDALLRKKSKILRQADLEDSLNRAVSGQLL